MIKDMDGFSLDLDSKPSIRDIQTSPLPRVVESYIRYYASGNSHTARAKRLDLKHFMEFLCSLYGCSKIEKLKVSHWDYSSVQRFVDHALRKGESPSTVARRLATLKHMGRTLSEKVAGFVNPAREVKPPRIHAERPQAIEQQEVKVIKKKAVTRRKEKDSFIRMRNETIFNFLLDTGIRVDELRNLRMAQLDENLEWVENVRTKGRRYRNVYITSAMREQLKAYLEARAEVLKKFYAKLTKTQDRLLPLFISTYNAVAGKPESFLMGSKTIWRAINELSTDTPLHPHLLRHSYAVDLLESSNDVRLVAQALGHSDVRITMRYTQRKDEEIAKALEKSRKRAG
ncbi:MAG: tyrosine-type recombinase/integrase [Deltaproteobacteria bacterium]|nr:tyrosine-type recombinase/integrase [Deltaproteobacteria bacterium]